METNVTAALARLEPVLTLQAQHTDLTAQISRLSADLANLNYRRDGVEIALSLELQALGLLSPPNALSCEDKQSQLIAVFVPGRITEAEVPAFSELPEPETEPDPSDWATQHKMFEAEELAPELFAEPIQPAEDALSRLREEPEEPASETPVVPVEPKKRGRPAKNRDSVAEALEASKKAIETGKRLFHHAGRFNLCKLADGGYVPSAVGSAGPPGSQVVARHLRTNNGIWHEQTTNLSSSPAARGGKAEKGEEE